MKKGDKIIGVNIPKILNRYNIVNGGIYTVLDSYIDRISYGATIEMLEMLKIKECGLQIPACYFKLSILQDRKSKINNLPK